MNSWFTWQAEKAKKEADKKAKKSGGGKAASMSPEEKDSYAQSDIAVILGDFGLGSYAPAFKTYGMEAVEDMMQVSAHLYLLTRIAPSCRT